MRLSLVTPPAAEPLTTAEAKQHLRVDAADDDTLIAALIVAARQAVETRLRRALVTQAWDLSLDEWPGRRVASRHVRHGEILGWWPGLVAHPLALPLPALQSVTSIAYVDPAGTTQTLDPSRYQVSAGTPGRVAPAYGTAWPATRHQMDAVTIRFVCGYGDAAAVPKCVKQAMLLLCGHWYEQREAVAVNVGANIMEMPVGVEALLAPEQHGGYS